MARFRRKFRKGNAVTVQPIGHAGRVVGESVVQNGECTIHTRFAVGAEVVGKSFVVNIINHRHIAAVILTNVFRRVNVAGQAVTDHRDLPYCITGIANRPGEGKRPRGLEAERQPDNPQKSFDCLLHTNFVNARAIPGNNPPNRRRHESNSWCPARTRAHPRCSRT